MLGPAFESSQCSCAISELGFQVCIPLPPQYRTGKSSSTSQHPGKGSVSVSCPASVLMGCRGGEGAAAHCASPSCPVQEAWGELLSPIATSEPAPDVHLGGSTSSEPCLCSSCRGKGFILTEVPFQMEHFDSHSHTPAGFSLLAS